jgi:hypothetical protein
MHSLLYTSIPLPGHPLFGGLWLATGANPKKRELSEVKCICALAAAAAVLAAWQEARPLTISVPPCKMDVNIQLSF